MIKDDRITKLLNAAQLALADALDNELYQPVKEELRQYDITHSLGMKKELFKHKVELIFEDLKKEMLRD